jgi:hypothetical protein
MNALHLFTLLFKGLIAGVLFGLSLLADGLAILCDWIATQCHRAAEWILS